MRFIILSAAFLFAVLIDPASAGFLFSSEEQDKVEKVGGPVTSEESDFWSRFLKGDSSITSSPSPAPSPAPTPAPTPGPTPSPTPSPTPGPTPAPTPAPTGLCLVEVTIECVDEDGNPCAPTIPPPPSQCADGTDIRVVTFEYLGGPCDSCGPLDPQGGDAICTGDAGTGEVQMVCLDGTTVLADITVNPSDTFTVEGAGAGPLPDILTCEARSTSDGSVLQTMTINTSGERNLQLTDCFGSIKLLSCDESDCLEKVTYTYTFANVGPGPMNLTVAERERGGEVVDFIPQISNTELQPGETITTTGMEVINICETATYTTTASAEADPPTGLPCFDTDVYEFTTSPIDTPPPTPAPTPVPSASPSSIPSDIPSESPSVNPTWTPSVLPSAIPSESPSVNPTLTPSVSPSASPTLAPTLFPTPSPTPVPTPAPTTLSPTATPTNVPPMCFLNSTCENRNPGANTTNCNEIPPIFIRCEARPQSMTWRYIGGDCDNSFNLQPPNQFECTDFLGGPPTQQGTLSWIQAEQEGGGEIFFDGPVSVREEWTLTAIQRVSANMDIRVYDGNPATGGQLLQLVNYHSSCSQALFLKDSFGANQLLSFTDEEGNTDTLALNVTFVYDLTVVQGEGDTVTSLVSITSPFGILNWTEDVGGMVIGPDGTFQFEANVTLDMGERREYTSLSFASVQDRFSQEVVQCDPSMGSFFQFTAGNPDFSPTPAPTLSPTATAQPTPDTETSACEIDALINCRVLGGPTYLPCGSLQAPTLSSCIDGLNRPDTANVPFTISFLYDGSTTGNREVVYIIAENERFQNFKGVVDLNEIWSPYGLDPRRTELTITVYTADPVDGGTVLESFALNVLCGADTDLVLGTSFGSNELVGFQIHTTNQFTKAQLGLDYDVENVGPFNAEVQSVNIEMAGSTIAFPLPLLVPKRETRTVEREQLILDLTTGNSVTRELTANAVNADSTTMLGCSDSIAETFTVR